MKKYQCSVCGYIYDPAKGVPKEGIQPVFHKSGFEPDSRKEKNIFKTLI